MASFGTLKRTLSIDTNPDTDDDTLFTFSPINTGDEPSQKHPKLNSIPILNLNKLSINNTSPIELIKKYYNEFQTKSRLNNLPIMVNNPIEPENMISLGNLFENICEKLQTEGIFSFTHSFPKLKYHLVKSQRLRKFNGVYSINENTTYTIESSKIYKSNNNKYIKKETGLYHEDAVTYTKAFVSIIHETCMQYYAYDLLQKYSNSNPNVFVIPKIHKISLKRKGLITKISIIMDNIPFYDVKEKDITDAFFEKWNKHINEIFSYFLKHNLKHNDTAYRNVYFTGTKINNVKLSIIDFGEAIFPETESTHGREEQYTGYIQYIASKSDFIDWLHGKGNVFTHHWGGNLTKKHKTIKNKTKKSNKNKQK